MKTAQLGDILNDAQIEAVLDIIESCPDPAGRIRKLKAYLSHFQDELEQKGVVSDYLAYVIEHMAMGLNKPDPARN